MKRCGCVRAFTYCRGDNDSDAKRSRPSIGKTRFVPREERARAFGWDPFSGSHQGQQPKRLHSKAEYMAAPERFAELSDSPCNAGAVHTWHIGGLPSFLCRTAEVEGIADSDLRRREVGEEDSP
jgi:hypothetical protein